MGLTVPNALEVRDFYKNVAGWNPAGVDMGGYEDFNMTHPDTGKPLARICHKRGANADLPPAWLIYIVVADLASGLDAVTTHGGKVLRPPKSFGPEGGFAIIEDPAGAVCALYQPAA